MSVVPATKGTEAGESLENLQGRDWSEPRLKIEPLHSNLGDTARLIIYVYSTSLPEAMKPNVEN